MTENKRLTARQFSEQMEVHYRTVLTWLARGLVPGAYKAQTIAGEHWEIPTSALGMKKPKVGRKATNPRLPF